jgi:hypothetical protein
MYHLVCELSVHPVRKICHILFDYLYVRSHVVAHVVIAILDMAADIASRHCTHFAENVAFPSLDRVRAPLLMCLYSS